LIKYSREALLYSDVNVIVVGVVEASDYCLMEEFNASCRQPDEVVVIERARYGRMAISRCVTGNYGHLGCYVDVRRLLHAKCSGRRSCRVRVPNDDLFATRPCPSDFTSYLEATYRCQTGKLLPSQMVRWTVTESTAWHIGAGFLPQLKFAAPSIFICIAVRLK